MGTQVQTSRSNMNLFYLLGVFAVIISTLVPPSSAQARIGACEMCQDIVTAIDQFLIDGATEQDIIDAVTGMCANLGSLLQGLCEKMIGEKLTQIIEDLVNNHMQPQEVCEQLKMCPVDESPVLRKITVVTGNGRDCGMGATGHLSVELIGNNYEVCSTKDLDNKHHDDFEEGQTDTFSGDILGSCTTQKFPANLFQFIVHHSGPNGWCMYSVELEFNTGERFGCVDNVFLDDSQTYNCFP